VHQELSDQNATYTQSSSQTHNLTTQSGNSADRTNKYGYLSVRCAWNALQNAHSTARNDCEVLLHTQLHCGPADCSQYTSGTLLGTNGERQGALGNAILAPRCWPYTCNYLGYKAAGVELGNAGLHSLLSLYWREVRTGQQGDRVTTRTKYYPKVT
jgi:hypothetical protein